MRPGVAPLSLCGALSLLSQTLQLAFVPNMFLCFCWWWCHPPSTKTSHLVCDMVCAMGFKTVIFRGSNHEVGFSKEMVAPDVLHCWHLGVCRDLIGSVVRLLVSERYWPGSNINDRLAFATASLKRWAKHRALSLTIKRLTKQNLSWGDQYFG